MAVAASMTLEDRSTQARMARPSLLGDKAFEWLTLAMALVVVVLIILIGWQLWEGSSLAIRKFGFHFLTTSTWDPVAEQFGALPFIYGTLVSSLIALLIAVPLSIATAAYLTELAPLWIRQPLVSLIEMLAAIPSVILGLWGIFVMIPWLRDSPQRSELTARSGLRARSHPLGSDPDRSVELRQKRIVRRSHSRPRTRAGRNDGGHDGDRQHAADRSVPVSTRLHARERAGQ